MPPIQIPSLQEIGAFFGVLVAIFTVIGGLYAFWRWLRGRSKPTAEQVRASLVAMDFGGGQPHIGKPELRVTNENTTLIHRTKLVIYVANRFRKWKFWTPKRFLYKEFELGDISARSSKNWILSLKELEEYLVKQKQVVDWQTSEPKPDYVDLLFPTPIKLDIELSFILEVQPMVQYRHLTPQCRFLVNILTMQYWKFTAEQ